ncbi:nuclear transport factor 2 family protein [Spongiibacter sp. KMU-166]|uniref:Nuclear transport factor 2 family protein n=1 Tax=Spongiibacter thalassae TaxID=2721624 RepID=A0ABX1GHJ0_9GAMM|nr:nuclear transport factor 2 family protein [Spongiibacter thalassae]NKI18692.1 nuclear transport factor 2 family protein [Spongiibacter thalassae]
MNDIDEIRNLIASYGQTVDSFPRDPRRYADHFVEEGAFTDCGVTLSPRSKIKQLMETARSAEVEAAPLSGTRHLQLNSVINVDGDSAHATSQLVVVELSEKGWKIRGIGQYTDDIVRDVDGCWRFKSKVVTWFKGLGPDPLNPELSSFYESVFLSIMNS